MYNPRSFKKTKLVFSLAILFFICAGNGAYLSFGDIESPGDKDAAEAAYRKANMLMESGLYAEAKSELKRALEYNPRHQGAIEGIMEINKRFYESKTPREIPDEKKEAFISEFRKGQEEAKKKEILETNYNLAVEFFRKENYIEARRYLIKVAREDPDYKDTRSILADITLAINRIKEESKRTVYTVGPGDVVTLYVKDNEDMSGDVRVQPGGEFVIPGINELVIANGMPKEMLEHIINSRLKKYLKEPSIQLVIKEYNSKKWYVLGEVRRRGAYSMAKPNLTLLEALYMADLPNEGKAAMRRVHLIHPDKNGPVLRRVNVYALLYQGDLSQNVLIHPGDIIYVPKTMITKVTDIINDVVSPISPYGAALEDLETILTTPPVTREGSGAGQRPN
ncbi:MAG: polysaccharide biosynthesis/export family protein [Candidatus Omnitrophica bacterium]|nr:polysaccharide biosynthesis/export family protein [Candidatus Omnitrophota bacterium]